MKQKISESVILFQVKEGILQALKCKKHKGLQPEIEAFVSEEYQNLEERSAVVEKTKNIFTRIGYNKEKVILVIPHKRVSCRYLKLPSQDNREIDEIIHLQSLKILPYPSEEIIIGKQIVDTDAVDFSFVNIVLVHKDSVGYLMDLLKEANVDVDSVFLSVYGISGLFKKIMPRLHQEVIVIRVRLPYVDILALNKGKICLSRNVYISKDEPDWQNRFFKQIMDTQSLYLRQGAVGPIKKVFLIDSPESTPAYQRILEEKLLIPVEHLLLSEERLGITKNNIEIKDFPYSIVELLGFIIQTPPESLNLLPASIREKKIRAQLIRHRLRLFLSAASVFLVLALILFKYNSNKKAFLSYLNNEVLRTQGQVKELEIMAKQLEGLKKQNSEKLKILDFFSAIHKVIPTGVFLAGIRYDAEGKERFSLEGYSEKLDSVFAYAANLKEANLLDGEVKVKHAASKRTAQGELINFEIGFLKNEE